MARTEILEKNKSDFRLEYGENAPDKALIDDVVSYLGEYRFNLPKFSYELKFSGGKLRDPHRGDSMQDIAQRAIGQKFSRRELSSRERAEKQGLMSLDNQLIFAKEEDTIVWASPPGSKEEGYGNYGFIFIGHVDTDDASGKTVQMTAIRLEAPKIEQFNKAIHLLTGKKTDYRNAEEFLANPKIIKEYLQDGYVDAILGISFSFKPNKEKQEKFEIIMRQMFPLISEFIRSAKDPWKTKEEKIKELYALENYAIKLKRDYDQPTTRRENFIVNFNTRPRLLDIREKYGNKPPEVAGSCPANTNNKNSFTSNIFSKGSIINGLFEDEIDYEFDKAGPCKKCSAEVSCGPCGLCRSCDLAIRASQRINLN